MINQRDLILKILRGRYKCSKAWDEMTFTTRRIMIKLLAETFEGLGDLTATSGPVVRRAIREIISKGRPKAVTWWLVLMAGGFATQPGLLVIDELPLGWMERPNRRASFIKWIKLMVKKGHQIALFTEQDTKWANEMEMEDNVQLRPIREGKNVYIEPVMV